MSQKSQKSLYVIVWDLEDKLEKEKYESVLLKKNINLIK
jgi:hypothetical protein